MKSVKVHDDTHMALKRLKAKRRARSVDQVIREMMRNAGSAVGEARRASDEEITTYFERPDKTEIRK
ncbi:MAG: hypothetical protein JRM80_14475 [Nitrososphaerota archaeon]|nr:hypothetical protein [Nitrososphaerota archaeon]MDG6990300.1 hypothetical protein [Nitrososphaerota archaeon]